MIQAMVTKLKQDESGAIIIVFYGLAVLSFLFYIYLPFKLWGLSLLIGVAFGAFNVMYSMWERVFFFHCLNITLSGLAVYERWHWGFTFLNFHIETYYCGLVFIGCVIAYFSGMIAWYHRRGENDDKKS